MSSSKSNKSALAIDFSCFLSWFPSFASRSSAASIAAVWKITLHPSDQAFRPSAAIKCIL